MLCCGCHFSFEKGCANETHFYQCEHCTAHVSHTQTFSRVWLKRSWRFAARIVFFIFQKKKKTVTLTGTSHVSRAKDMTRPHSSSTFSQHSILTRYFERENTLRSATCRPDWPSCRTLQVMRTTNSVEASSTEVTTMLLPSRRRSSGSAYNSGEDVTSALASSEVDERQILGMLASPLCTQKREASAAPSRVYHSNTENSVSGSSHFATSTGKPVACTHTRESQVEIQ